MLHSWYNTMSSIVCWAGRNLSVGHFLCPCLILPFRLNISLQAEAGLKHWQRKQPRRWGILCWCLGLSSWWLYFCLPRPQGRRVQPSCSVSVRSVSTAWRTRDVTDVTYAGTASLGRMEELKRYLVFIPTVTKLKSQDFKLKTLLIWLCDDIHWNTEPLHYQAGCKFCKEGEAESGCRERCNKGCKICQGKDGSGLDSCNRIWTKPMM